MEKSIVTGGCGFIGRNLTRKLLKMGQNVLVIDDLSTGLAPELWQITEDNAALTFLNLPCESDQAKKQILTFSKGASNLSFFHFAGIVKGRKFIESHPFHISKNLHIDNCMFRLASELKPSHFIYPSSSAVYPVAFQEEENYQALREDLVSHQNFSAPDKTYGWAKLMGEIHAKILFNQYHVPTTIIRPFSGYGPDQSLSYPLPAIVRRFIDRENPMTIWGRGLQLRDFIYIDDLIDAIFLALEHFANARPVNLGSGVATSFMQVLECLSEITSFAPNIVCDTSKPEGVFGRYCDPRLLGTTANWSPKYSLRLGLEEMLERS